MCVELEGNSFLFEKERLKNTSEQKEEIQTFIERLDPGCQIQSLQCMLCSA